MRQEAREKEGKGEDGGANGLTEKIGPGGDAFVKIVVVEIADSHISTTLGF